MNLRLTYPIVKKEDPREKKLYNFVEIAWHTLLPLIFVWMASEYSKIFLFFILFSLIRLRPEPKEMR